MFKQLSAATSILLAFFGAAPAGAQPGAICAQSGVVAGGDHTCAFTVLGAAMCWGDNQFGQVGNGAISTSVPVPTRVSGLMPATNGAGQPPTFVAGQRHTCAIVLPGMTPMCWGDRGAGQLGDGQIGGLSLTPVPVVADPAHAPFPAFTLAAGDSHTCAIDTGLHVQCWGDDRVGQLGDGRSGAGASSANPTFPVAAPSILDAPAIGLAAGLQHTCAVMQDHTARCWGDNSFCQIGDDSRCQVGNAIAISPVTRPQGVLYGRGLPGIGPFLVDVVQVAAGESHTCALLNGPAFPSNGNVTCWGTGDEGELVSDDFRVVEGGEQLYPDAEVIGIPAPSRNAAAARALGVQHTIRVRAQR